jgi:hypothetical protein
MPPGGTGVFGLLENGLAPEQHTPSGFGTAEVGKTSGHPGSIPECIGARLYADRGTLTVKTAEINRHAG